MLYRCTQKIFKQHEKLVDNLYLIFAKTILSSAYPCTKLWEERLETPLLKPIKMDDYAFQIFQRHDTLKFISPVDLDIYCNRALNDEHADNVKDMLSRVRLLDSYLDTLHSTYPAIMRLLLQLKKDEDILELLNNKVKYGVFPDNITLNIIMDYFIKKDKGKDAAQVAYHLILQEDLFSRAIDSAKELIYKDYECDNSLNVNEEFFSHISPYMAVYALLLHLKQNYLGIMQNDNNKSKDEKIEEILYLRVPYIARYYFDDHFDLLKQEDKNKGDQLLLGKSLAYIGNSNVNKDFFNNIIGRSCEIYGLTLWRKFDKLVAVLKTHLETDSEPAITKDSVDFIFPQIDAFKQELAEEKIRAEEKVKADAQYKKHLEMFDIDQPPSYTQLDYDLDNVKNECKELVKELEGQGKVSNVSTLFDLAKNYVETNIKLWEQTDIQAQKDIFAQWIKDREVKLQQQIDRHFMEEKKNEIAAKRKELEEEEKLLTFFDREKEVEILLDKAEKLRDLLKKQNEPPPQAKDYFKSSFERMTS